MPCIPDQLTETKDDLTTAQQWAIATTSIFQGGDAAVVTMPDASTRASIDKRVKDRLDLIEQEAGNARDAAISASEASGDVNFYDDKAAANTALSGLSEGQVVEVLEDESLGGARTRYRVESAAYVFKIALPSGVHRFPSLTGTGGAAAAVTDGLIDTGDAISTAGYAAAGDGGGFTGVVEAANNAAYPGGGRIKPLNMFMTPQMFGALGDGATDDTTAFQAAAACVIALGRRAVWVPGATYRVGNIGTLNNAGTRWIGDSGWKSILEVITGTTGSIFYNPNAATGAAAYVGIENLYIDLRSQNVIAVDFDRVNNSTARNVHVKGGTDFASATGIGFQFKASVKSGSYNNVFENSTATYCNQGFNWGEGANLNQVAFCEAIGCNYGFRPYQAATGANGVDTPMIVGGRAEGCDVGLIEGATAGCYLNLRFESSVTADVEFSTYSQYAKFVGGYTAASALVLKNITLATSPSIDSSELGHYALEDSTARPRYISGRTVLAAAGNTPSAPSQTGHSAYFQDWTYIRNAVAHEHQNAAGDNRIIGATATASDVLQISGYNRKTAAYGVVEIGGGGSVRPIGDGATQLGTASRRWSEVFAVAGAINTSDARDKSLIDDEAELAALAEAVSSVALHSFHWRDALAQKGDAARVHVGVLAQEIEAAIRAKGLDPARYALWCADPVTEERPVLDENGAQIVDGAGPRTETVPVLDENGEPVIRQGLRFDQIAWLSLMGARVAAATQADGLAAITARIEALEKE